MIAIQHHLDNSIDLESIFSHESFADSLEITDSFDDSAIWDDCRLAEVARDEIAERNALVTELIQLTLSSLSSYQEIAELALDRHLQSFAVVVVRQRGAQCEELRQLLIEHWDHDVDQPKEALSAIRSIWRLAIWHFEQNQLAHFMEYAERAESLLEEMFLSAANAYRDDAWARLLRSHAIMICGARNIWDDLAHEIADQPENPLS